MHAWIKEWVEEGWTGRGGDPRTGGSVFSSSNSFGGHWEEKRKPKKGETSKNRKAWSQLYGALGNINYRVEVKRTRLGEGEQNLCKWSAFGCPLPTTRAGGKPWPRPPIPVGGKIQKERPRGSKDANGRGLSSRGKRRGLLLASRPISGNSAGPG